MGIMFKTDRIDLGKSGEEKAAEFLREKGFRVVARNYRTRIGEVDLICKDGEQIVFVEVKTRRSLAFGDGAEAVNHRKREKLIKAAQLFLKSIRREDAPFRFDVVSVLSGETDQITHIPCAFP